MSEQKMIAAICPVCKTSNGVSSAFAGKKVICQKCEEIFVCKDSEIDGGDDIDQIERITEVVRESAPPNSIPPPNVSDTKKIPIIAKLAIMYKYIQKDQCDIAISKWENEKRNGVNVTLEEIFTRDNLIQPDQMVKLRQAIQYLELKQKDKEFCARALEMGFLLSSEATWALEKQAKEFKEKGRCIRVGEILVESEAITEIEHKLISEQVGSTPSPGSLAIVESLERDGATQRDESKVFFNKDLMTISVSEDGLKAYLTVSDKGSDISLDFIKEVLEEKCISYGIVEDKQIIQFIKNWADSNRLFKIAEGSYPVLGANATVKYLFETDHLKAGTLSEKGSIDFKDRGTIPFVHKGDLLAEKVPAKAGSPGIDIYGNPISVDDPIDIELNCGIGAVFLDDRTKVFADVNGYPSTTIDHVISVVQGIDIKGDVGYETGHVEFDGHINVEGIVKEGFRVKGTSLCAREVVGAQIDVTGDIIIEGGVIGSKIKTQGNIEATYVRETEIISFGDIIISKQIIDSSIVTSGACYVPRGTILSSDIAARKGVKAYDIGTDISAPNKVRVGTDAHVDNVLNEIKNSLEAHEQEKGELNERLMKVKEDLQNVFNLIAEMAHVQDRAMKQKASIMETMDKFSQKKNQRKLGPAEKSLQEIEEQVQSADNTIDRLFATQNAYKDKIENIKEKIKSVNEKIISLNADKNAIRQFAEREKSDPTITVYGSIHDKTIVMGKKSSRILEETYRNVRIKEVKLNESGVNSTWEMRVFRKTY